MEAITIGYDFRFDLVVRKSNGKTYKKHIITGLGITFESALWTIFFKLKKSKTEILDITGVEPIRIAFAFRGEENLRLKLADYLPLIPEDFAQALNLLPKK